MAKKTDAEIAQVHAVDITFRDAEGNEVEPAKKVTVTMASPQIQDGIRHRQNADDRGETAQKAVFAPSVCV